MSPIGTFFILQERTIAIQNTMAIEEPLVGSGQPSYSLQMPAKSTEPEKLKVSILISPHEMIVIGLKVLHLLGV